MPKHKPWADFVDDLFDDAGEDDHLGDLIGDHLGDLIGDDQEDCANDGQLREKQRDWMRKGLPLHSLKPALDEAALDDADLVDSQFFISQRSGQFLLSVPHLRTCGPPSQLASPLPSQTQRGPCFGFALQGSRGPTSHSSASRSRSPSPPAPAHRDGDDPNPMDKSFEGPPAEAANMGKTPLKADSPKFTPACINTSKPMGSKTLSTKAQSFTPGAKAAKIGQFFVLGLQPAGYGEYGCESWQQGNGGHSGYGS